MKPPAPSPLPATRLRLTLPEPVPPITAATAARVVPLPALIDSAVDERAAEVVAAFRSTADADRASHADFADLTEFAEFTDFGVDAVAIARQRLRLMIDGPMPETAALDATLAAVRTLQGLLDRLADDEDGAGPAARRWLGRLAPGPGGAASLRGWQRRLAAVEAPLEAAIADLAQAGDAREQSLGVLDTIRAPVAEGVQNLTALLRFVDRLDEAARVAPDPVPGTSAATSTATARSTATATSTPTAIAATAAATAAAMAAMPGVGPSLSQRRLAASVARQLERRRGPLRATQVAGALGVVGIDARLLVVREVGLGCAAITTALGRARTVARIAAEPTSTAQATDSPSVDRIRDGFEPAARAIEAVLAYLAEATPILAAYRAALRREFESGAGAR